jgi:hypothetical protein
VKKYHDYDFNRDFLLAPENDQRNFNLPELKPATATDFIAFVNEEYSTNENLESVFPKEQFLQKIETVIAVYSNEEKNILRGFMTQAGFEAILETVKKTSEEELRKSSAVSLHTYLQLKAPAETTQ